MCPRRQRFTRSGPQDLGRADRDGHGCVDQKQKNDRKDVKHLARFLRLDEVPESYVPPEKYRHYRALTRRQKKLVERRSAFKKKKRGFNEQSAADTEHTPVETTTSTAPDRRGYEPTDTIRQKLAAGIEWGPRPASGTSRWCWRPDPTPLDDGESRIARQDDSIRFGREFQ